jgi:2-polyprenyl-3-methyl-5-hydroxy-6-metoxy-1,4-benzoquinol methylase
MDVAMPALNAAYTVEDQQRMTRARNYFAWQARLILPELGRRVLEIGCGIGNFTHLLRDRETVIAVDCEPACIDLVKSRCPNAQALALDASTDSILDLARFAPDSCLLLNVLEHIEDDRATLKRIASILPPRGRVVILAPASPSLYGPIDHNLGHYRRYSRASLTALARHAGLEIRKMHHVNAAGFFGWWINAHLLRRAAQSESQIGVFDRLVPMFSRIEAIAPPPFGQSLFAVFEKS